MISGDLVSENKSLDVNAAETVTAPNPKKKKAKPVETAFEWIDSLVVAMVAVVLIFTFFLGKVKVDGESMLDTLHDADQLLITNFNYMPKAGDIVIVSRNIANSPDHSDNQDTKPIVKRIIAVGGDTIKIEDGSVFVNGEKLDESEYVRTQTSPVDLKTEQVVPEGCVFVMGDNRNDSHDSRYSDIGFVDERYILGKALIRIYPFDQITIF